LKVDFPPNSSILSSMIYEGYLYILSKCGDNPSADCLKSLWNTDVKFYFVGNDVKNTFKKLTPLLPQCGKLEPNLISLSKCFSQITPNLDIGLRIDGDVIVGNNLNVGKNGLSFQIMKVDRYMGISSMESGLIKEQVTVFSDLSGVYVFLLGLISSNVITIGTEYYFLLFDTSEIPNCLVQPTLWFSIKDKIKEELGKTLKSIKRISDEIISLELLLNSSVIGMMKNNGLEEVNLRLLKIVSEGKSIKRNTYKVYNDFPVQLISNRKIYDDINLVKSLESLVNFLIIPASNFLNGNDKGDGYHAYNALKYLYMFLASDNFEFLNMAIREIHEANKANDKVGYLNWITKLTIT